MKETIHFYAPDWGLVLIWCIVMLVPCLIVLWMGRLFGWAGALITPAVVAAVALDVDGADEGHAWAALYHYPAAPADLRRAAWIGGLVRVVGASAKAAVSGLKIVPADDLGDAAAKITAAVKAAA